MSKVVLVLSVLSIAGILIGIMLYFLLRSPAETPPADTAPVPANAPPAIVQIAPAVQGTPAVTPPTTAQIFAGTSPAGTPAETTVPVPTIPPPPVSEPTVVPPATPAIVDIAGVCNGILDNEAKYYFDLYPDVLAAAKPLPTKDAQNTFAKTHWNTYGFKEGRKSCWPIPPATGYATLATKAGSCNGILENEANYYFNLYPDIWQYVNTNSQLYPTKAKKNEFAKLHATGTGATEGRISCWTIPKPPAGACDGTLENEANYYFNLYNDIWQYANKNFKTKAEMNNFAQIHAVGTGKTEGRRSCWTTP